jgi:exodeoxyribonuclease X
VFVAHNASVDLGVLTRELPGFTAPHVVDTLKMARAALPGRRSYQLGALVADLGLAGDLPAALSPHRASGDALACARLFVRPAEHLGTRSLVAGGDHERDVLFWGTVCPIPQPATFA